MKDLYDYYHVGDLINDNEALIYFCKYYPHNIVEALIQSQEGKRAIRTIILLGTLE